MEAIVGLWILCAIACGIIASNKGYGFVGWFLIGLVLGVIGLIMIATMSKRVVPEGVPAEVLKENWSCPKCKKLWSGSTISCLDCGTKNPAIAATEKKCPMCAESIKAEAKVCRYCGHKFE